MGRFVKGKGFFLVALLVAFLLGSLPALAGDDFVQPYKFYGTLKGGVVLLANQGSVSSVNPNATGLRDQDSTSNAAIAGAAFGYRPHRNVRMELEAAMQSKLGFHNNFNLTGGTETNDLEVNNSTLFLKGYYDFKIHPCVNPYLTAGLGLSRNEAKGTQTNSIDTSASSRWQTNTSDNLGWLLGFGMSWALHERVILDLGYEYRDLGDWKLSNLPVTPGETMSGHLTGHIIFFGIRGNF